MKSKTLLVTLADENYVKQTKQLFSSVYWNAGWKGDYMLLSHNIPEKELKWFRKRGIIVRKCKSLCNKKAGVERHPPLVLDKFYLFTPKFKKWKNIVYLDSDIIVRASVEELTKIKGFAAPRSTLGSLANEFVRKNEADRKLFNNIKKNYDIKEKPFCTGIVVFSTDIIKKDTFSKLMWLFNQFGKISRVGEEGAVNLFFHKNWKELPFFYNVFVSQMMEDYDIKPENIKGKILHFIGSGKDGRKEYYRAWHKKNYFYTEWRYNLDRADLIDLKNRKKGKRWGEADISRYMPYLRYKTLYSKIKSNMRIFYNLTISPNTNIGRIGIIIKKISPRLYYKLRKIKNEI